LQGNDPWVIAVSAILLVMVAFVAGEIPALRASRIHPMQALRYE
jgi:ABC-type antimicrobial peptide transport system permease subunit